MESGNRKLEPYLKAAFTEMKGTMTMTSEFEKAWIQPVTRKPLENCQKEGLVKDSMAEQNRQKQARKDSGLQDGLLFRKIRASVVNKMAPGEGIRT